MSEETGVQDKVAISEEAEVSEVPEVTEIPDLQGIEEETQEETPLPVQEPTRRSEISSQPVVASRKEKPVSSVSRKDRDMMDEMGKLQNDIDAANGWDLDSHTGCGHR